MPRTQHTYGADHILLGVVIGRDHQRAAGIDEQLVLGADEDLHAIAFGGGVQKAEHILARFELVEKLADCIELLTGLDVIQKIGLATHYQNRVLGRAAAGPEPDPGLDKPLRDTIQLGPLHRDLRADHAGRCRQVTA